MLFFKSIIFRCRVSIIICINLQPLQLAVWFPPQLTHFFVVGFLRWQSNNLSCTRNRRLPQTVQCTVLTVKFVRLFDCDSTVQQILQLVDRENFVFFQRSADWLEMDSHRGSTSMLSSYTSPRDFTEIGCKYHLMINDIIIISRTKIPITAYITLPRLEKWLSDQRVRVNDTNANILP